MFSFMYIFIFSLLFAALFTLHRLTMVARSQSEGKTLVLECQPKIFEWFGKTRPEGRRRGRESKQLDIFYRQMSRAS